MNSVVSDKSPQTGGLSFTQSGDLDCGSVDKGSCYSAPLTSDEGISKFTKPSSDSKSTSSINSGKMLAPMARVDGDRKIFFDQYRVDSVLLSIADGLGTSTKLFLENFRSAIHDVPRCHAAGSSQSENLIKVLQAYSTRGLEEAEKMHDSFQDGSYEFSSFLAAKVKISRICRLIYETYNRVPDYSLQQPFDWSGIGQFKPLSLSALIACATNDEQCQTISKAGKAFLNNINNKWTSRLQHGAVTDICVDWGARGLHLMSSYATEVHCEAIQYQFNVRREGELASRSQLWNRVLTDNEVGPVNQRIKSLKLEIRDRRQQLMNLRRHQPPCDELQEMLSKGVFSQQEQLLNNASDGLDSAARHIKQHRKYRAHVLLDQRLAHRPEDLNLASGLIVDRDTDKMIEPRQALRDQLESAVSFTQRAEIFLDRHSIASESWVVAPSRTSEHLRSRLESALKDAELVCARKNVDFHSLSAVGEARGLLAVLAHHDTQSGENNLLADQIFYRVRHALMYNALADEQIRIVRALVVQAKNIKNLRPASGVLAGRGSWAGAVEGAGQSESAVEQINLDQLRPRQGNLPSAALLENETAATSEQGPWHLVAEKHVSLTAETRQKIENFFDRGTFGSSLQSCIYHWRKHGASIQDSKRAIDQSSLLGYLQSALEAREQWSAAINKGFGYRSPSLLNPAVMMRVINSPDIFLVTTDEDQGKIVSFRHRAVHGR